MPKKTLPLLNPTAAIATNTLFLVRRNGQIEDEKTTGADLQSFFWTNPALSGGTANNMIIGGTTPAAGTFTTVTAPDVIGTDVQASGAAGIIIKNSGGTTVATLGASNGTTANFVGTVTINTLNLTNDLAVTEGGTGASTATNARANLGLIIGTDIQAYDAGLLSIAGLVTAADRGIYTTALDTYSIYTLTAGGRALAGVAGTANTFPYFSALNTVTLAAITAAGLAILDDVDATAQRATLGLVIGTNVQAYDADLAALAANATNGIWARTGAGTGSARTITGTTNRLTVTNGDGVSGNPTLDISTSYVGQATITTLGTITTGVWNGTTIAVANGGTGATTAGGARTNLGLGTISTQDANNVSISGGSITGIADLAVADGGTGASTAGNARTNLDVYSKAETDALATPVGAIIPYGPTAAPTGWLLCYGQAVSRATYAALFTAISTTYGAGDGSTTFNVPDLRGRVVAGQDDMGGTSANRLTGLSGGVDGDVLGAAGGAESHTLTSGELAAHTHEVLQTSNGNTGANSTGVIGSGTNTGRFSQNNTGAGGAHNNVQPTFILNYIIKT